MRSELTLQEKLLRKTIPVVINSFNQYTYLKSLIDKLQEDYFKNIIVIDNASSYKPLLKYYEELNSNGQAIIIYYGENKGPHHFHMKGLYKLFASLPHIYSDPDLTYDFLANNFLTELLVISEKYSMFKVGPALEIPTPESIDSDMYSVHNGRSVGIAEWERKYWENEIEPGVFYPGHIDTTFHLFNPRYFKEGSDLIDGLRLGGTGFVFKHLPWYRDKGGVPEQELSFYEREANGSSSWKRREQSASLRG